MMTLIANQFNKDIMENKELFIKDEQEYDAAMARIETLIAAIPEDAPAGTSQGIELRLLARAVQQYEQATCRMPVTIGAILKDAMHDLKLSQYKLAKLLSVSAPRISEWINGKSVPPPVILRLLRDKLNIDANLILDAIAVNNE
jgi:antitoxin component HigA of HigAB toxin-antitoxin module